MRALLFVLAIVAVSAMAVDPVLPKSDICSIQASGKAELNVAMQKFEGTVTMKRVRDSVRIDVTTIIASFSQIARDDQGKTSTDVTSSNNPGVTPGCYPTDVNLRLSDYEFDGEAYNNYNKFTHASGAAMFFSLDNNTLMREDFSISLNGIPVTLVVTYTPETLQAYTRTDAADGAFNSEACSFTGNDEYALTAKCSEEPPSESGTPTPATPSPSSSDTGAAGVIVPSLAVLHTAAVLLL